MAGVAGYRVATASLRGEQRVVVRTNTAPPRTLTIYYHTPTHTQPSINATLPDLNRWIMDDSLEALSQCLSDDNFVVIPEFLPLDAARMIRSDIDTLRSW